MSECLPDWAVKHAAPAFVEGTRMAGYMRTLLLDADRSDKKIADLRLEIHALRKRLDEVSIALEKLYGLR